MLAGLVIAFFALAAGQTATHPVSPNSPDPSGCRYVYQLNSTTCPYSGGGQ